MNSELLVKAEFDISHLDSQFFEHVSSTLTFPENVPATYFVEKLLAFALLHHKNLELNPKLAMATEPEIFLKKNDIQYVEWVSLGHLDNSLLEHAEAKAEHIWLFFSEQDKNQKLLSNINRHPRLQMIEFEDELINSLTQIVDKKNEWTIMIDQNHLSIACHSHYFESKFKIHHPLTIPFYDLIH